MSYLLYGLKSALKGIDIRWQSHTTNDPFKVNIGDKLANPLLRISIRLIYLTDKRPLIGNLTGVLEKRVI